MQFIISIAIFSVMTDSCSLQQISESPQEEPPKVTLKTQVDDPGNPEAKSNLKDMFYAPPEESQIGVPNTHYVEFRPPHSVTKLAKTIAYGFEPHFKKNYFEPFESRPKLVKLVAFRKNGLLTKKNVQGSQEQAEVAELQSPFNIITNN